LHHLMVNYLASAGAAITTNTNVPASTDTIFTTQNSNFIFTDQLQFLAITAQALDLTIAQVYSPTLIPYGLINIWPLNNAQTPGSYPNIFDVRDMPIAIPMNEQIQTLVQDSNAAGEIITSAYWVSTPGWTRNKVQGSFRAILNTTLSFTTVAHAWSGAQVLTFTNQPIGGWYAVNGAYMLESHSRYFRLIFPRAPNVNGRQFRPGTTVTHASGNLEYPNFNNGLGCWGGFHTFEPVQCEVWCDTATAITPTLYLDVSYLGQAPAGAYPPALPVQ
jgi:hypothetical protein